MVLVSNHITMIVLSGNKLHKLLLEAAKLAEEIESNGCIITNIVVTGEDFEIDSGDFNQIRIYHTRHRLQ